MGDILEDGVGELFWKSGVYAEELRLLELMVRRIKASVVPLDVSYTARTINVYA